MSSGPTPLSEDRSEDRVAHGIAGDETTGRFVPQDVRPSPAPRLAQETIKKLSEAPGLAATASDVLDELGYSLAVPASILQARTSLDRAVAGHVLTLRYLPERRPGRGHDDSMEESRLAHHVVFEMANRGDVVVIEASGLGAVSVFGGMAALAAGRAGIAGCIVDGGVRDRQDIEVVGLAVWSRELTPITGKWRAAAESINAPICCGGVQVRAGDLVLADDTGICFVPAEIADIASARILAISATEATAYADASTTSAVDEVRES
jgi:regulator of RNase E activity RraA